MSAIRSDLEENGTQDAKVSDSGYSNSCRNSQSQRSTGSSKSRHSNSSGSSGYCGHPPALGSVCEDSGSSEGQSGSTKRKEQSENKGKCKSGTICEGSVLPSGETVHDEPAKSDQTDISQQQQQQNPSQQIDQMVNLRSPSNNCEALQIAALTQTLTCIKTLKHKDRTAEEDGRNQSRLRIDDKSQDIINNCIKNDSINEEEMQIVVSMQDGVVLYTSSNLIDVLGYPKDMWVGRSLIDFVHPRHRIAFANHITSIIASSQTNLSGNGSSRGKHAIFFCCLRQYRGLVTTGFSVVDKKVSYIPCQMSVNFREFQTSAQASPTIFLVIATTPVRSAYKYPDENKVSPKFTIRHCSLALMSHVDPEVVQYLGYLPQDLVGQSVFDFYHPEDLPIIKSTYHSVITEERQTVRSKPYRFRCQNGGFVKLDTEWSAFVNPWSRKLEFMIGQHVILKGPPFPDVTTPVEFEPVSISEDIHKEAKKIEEEIKALLSTTVGCNTEMAKKQASKRCKDLATFMETFMDEINKPPDTKAEVHMEDDKSFSERDSVMLGEISPHHEYYDSKSSSETPPSYNQLNYKENLQRFFESQPKTTLSDESAEVKNSGALGTTSGTPTININNSEGSRGESSGEGQSYSCKGGPVVQTPVAPVLVPEKQTTHCRRSSKYNPPLLTEQLLSKHNEDMEKQMVQKHREQRSRSSENKFKDKHKSLFDKQQEEMGAHGLKRSGSHSFESEPFKAIKSTHESQSKPNNLTVTPTSVQPNTSTSSVSLWSPFPVDTQAYNNNRPNINSTALPSPLMPIYFIPPPPAPQQEPRPDASASVFNPFLLPQGGGNTLGTPSNNNYMAGMVYQPLLVGAAPGPVLYSPLTVLPAPVFPTHPPMKPPQPPQQQTQLPQCTRCDSNWRPGSEATSLNAQPGSTSTSNRQNLSEQCKSTATPRLTTDGESFGTSNVYDDSSFYSSYGSFALIKTDKSDESMKSSSENEKREMSWDRSGKHGGSLKNRPVKMVAPWMQEVTLTTELTLKYQLKDRHLDEVLRADIEALEKINQPSLVNDQLCQMYLDLELEGLSKTLTLEEGITSSSSDSSPDDPQGSSSKDKKKKKRFLEYEKMAIVYEENAPFPPPLVEPSPT